MTNTQPNNRVITTEDGSHSLYNEKLNETYHSFHGAIQESQHVFIEAGLEYLSFASINPIRVFEVGFGTGLNVLLAALWASSNKVSIQMDSIEAYPIETCLQQELNYPKLLNDSTAEEYFKSIHESGWNQYKAINDHFTLKKIHSSIEEENLNSNFYNVIFFDAFAPSKQPEMWTVDILRLVANSLIPGGVFVTYCAKGQLKRDLKALSLEVETLPGPPGKKEMVRGTKI